MTSEARFATGRVDTLRYAARGLGLGLAWGVGARLWMGMVSSDQQLSWRGTLGVLVSAGLAGTLVGVAHAAGLRGATNAWRALALPGVALFLGPGLPFLPAFLLGGWGMRRGSVGRAVAVLSVAAAPVLLVQTLWFDGAEGVVAPTDAISLLLVAGGGGLLAVTSAWAGSATFGPWTGRRPAPSTPTPSTDRVPVLPTDLARAA
ncbi:MAG: hypothetical protein ABIW80_00815 [Lapillicoccus sp.]